MNDTTVSSNERTANREEIERLAAGVLMVGFPGHSVPAGTADLIRRGVRSIILFGRNVDEKAQVLSLTGELRSLGGDDILIAIDHEGGHVNRLSKASTQWPGPMAWAATGDDDLAYRASKLAASELGALGINLNFAPVADLLGNYHNPVLGIRPFSDDPAISATLTAAFVKGHRQAHIGSTAKHFPGHGGTSIDSHVDMPEVDHDLTALHAGDLVPFKAAIREGVDCLMISHIWYSKFDDEPTPATLSGPIIDLARTGLGYDGLIVTDCMEMGAIQRRLSTGDAVVRAIAAGVDLAIVSHTLELQREALDALIRASLDGTISMERLVEANERIDRLRERVRYRGIEVAVGGEELAREIATKAVTVVRDLHDYLPLQLTDGETLGVVTFEPRRPTGVENTQMEESRLAEGAKKYHPRVVEVRIRAGEGDDSPEELASADTILVGTNFTTGNPSQAGTVKALLRAGKRVVVLALNDPFDLLSFPDAPCYLATYGDTHFQIDAALAVLFGVSGAQGRLPVALADLHGRGHGVSSGL